jgi:UDP-glucose 4-epimerase
VKLLVTGGAGYIGSVVANQLLHEGHEVVVLDNLSKGHEKAFPEGARFVKGDLLDAEEVRGALAERFDGVLHFAALSLVSESVEHPERYYRNNVCGTLNLLEAMREAGVERLVFSSTAAVYGEPEEVPIPETSPTSPTSPYGSSKLAVDHMIRAVAEARGLAATSLRYFNVAGASGRFGVDHNPETHLIPLVLQAAAGVQDSVKIFGTDYPTRDGTAVRDYIHVEDLGRAHLLALEAAKQGEHRIYNLGNGAARWPLVASSRAWRSLTVTTFCLEAASFASSFSVREVIETARKVTGRRIEAVESPRRSGDPAVLVASSDKIRGELGWKPEKPELEAMISDAWKWMQAHRDGYE